MASLPNIKHTVTPQGDANIAHFQSSRSTFSTIRVVVHTMGRQPNGMSDNHVSVFLLLSAGSIRLNMAAEEGSVSGDLVWSNHDYQITASNITYFDILIPYSVEVGMLYNYIRQWGLQRYRFSGGGSGCRYWVYILISKIAELRWIHASWPTTVWQKHSYQYSREVEPQLIAIKKGEFISQDKWEEEFEE